MVQRAVWDISLHPVMLMVLTARINAMAQRVTAGALWPMARKSQAQDFVAGNKIALFIDLRLLAWH